MKMLTLIRHAKSSWEQPELADLDRPLNKRGKRDAPKMGQRLVQKQLQPDLFITSPAKRAFTTAKAIAEEIGYGMDELVTDDRAYTADAAELLAILRDVDNAYHDVVLVGHNPAMTNLVNYLTSESIDNVPTCGIVRASFSVDAWSKLRRRTGELVWFDYPKSKGD